MLGVSARQPWLYILEHVPPPANFSFPYLSSDFSLLVLCLCLASLSFPDHLHQNNTMLVKTPQWCSAAKSSSHNQDGRLQPKYPLAMPMSILLCGLWFFPYAKCGIGADDLLHLLTNIIWGLERANILTGLGVHTWLRHYHVLKGPKISWNKGKNTWP